MNRVHAPRVRNTRNAVEGNMTDDKKKTPITNDVLIADIMLRVTSMEKLLIDKGIFTLEELTATTEEIARNVARVVLEKAQASKTVDEFLAELKGEAKDKKVLKN
jgi:hypothetical protein